MKIVVTNLAKKPPLGTSPEKVAPEGNGACARTVRATRGGLHYETWHTHSHSRDFVSGEHVLEQILVAILEKPVCGDSDSDG